MSKRIVFLISSLFLFTALLTYVNAAPLQERDAPAIAYDSQNNRFLIVYEGYDGSQRDIYGQILYPDGTTFVSEFVISNAANDQDFPKVAYDSTNGSFLVVWEDSRGANDDIYGQLVDASDGSLLITASGTNFVISNATNDQKDPSVAYNSTNGRFLVVWEDSRGASDDIYGQLVNGSDGSLLITAPNVNFAISNPSLVQNQPTVAFDSANSSFLVAWHDLRSGTNDDIYGQLVNGLNGSLIGPPATQNFTIADSIANQIAPSVAYDSANQRFLVVWDDFRNSNNDVYGQLVDGSDGSLFNTISSQNFTISDHASNQTDPSVSYDSSNGRFLVTWHDPRNNSITELDVFGQFLNVKGDGTIDPPLTSNINFAVSTAGNNQRFTAAAYNSDCGNFLVAFESKEFFPTNFGLTTVGNSCRNISVSPTSLNLGSASIAGSSTPLEVTISNTGGTSLNVSAITLSDTTNFSLNTSGGANPCGGEAPDIGSSTNCTTTVTLNPSSTGTKNATLTINSNDPETPTLNVSLTGNGTVPDILAAPASHDFGNVTIGSSSSLEITIANGGTADLKVSGISLSTTSDFTLNPSGAGTSPCGSTTPTVAAGGDCRVSATFSPQSSGAKTSILTISSDDPDSPIVSTTLTGSGVSASATPSPTPTSNQAPTADAGSDQMVSDNKLVILDGTGSSDPDGDPLTYIWSQIAGPNVTLNGANTARPDFTAPDVTSDTTLSFQLIVSDGSLNSSPSTVNVTVRPMGQLMVSAGVNNPSSVELSDTGGNVSLMQVSLEAVENTKLTSIAFTINLTSFSESAKGEQEVDLGSLNLKLYLDGDGDGEVDSDETELGEEVYSSSDVKVTFAGLSQVISKGASENLLLSSRQKVP